MNPNNVIGSSFRAAAYGALAGTAFCAVSAGLNKLMDRGDNQGQRGVLGFEQRKNLLALATQAGALIGVTLHVLDYCLNPYFNFKKVESFALTCGALCFVLPDVVGGELPTWEKISQVAAVSILGAGALDYLCVAIKACPEPLLNPETVL